MLEDSKICPYCTEEIKPAAIVCKHCGRELPGFEDKYPGIKLIEPEPLIEKEAEKKTPWQASHNFATIIAIISVIVAVYNNYNSLTGEFSQVVILDAVTYFVANYFVFRVVGAFLVWLQGKFDILQAIMVLIILYGFIWFIRNKI